MPCRQNRRVLIFCSSKSRKRGFGYSNRNVAYDNRKTRTQDAAILADAAELTAAHRSKFMLRMRRKTGNNRDYADASMRDVPRLTLRVRCKNRDRAPNLVYKICRSNYLLKETFLSDIFIKLPLH